MRAFLRFRMYEPDLGNGDDELWHHEDEDEDGEEEEDSVEDSVG